MPNQGHLRVVLQIITIGFCCAIILVSVLNWPFWITGVLVGGIVFILSFTEPNWRVQDWYTLGISVITISLIILITYWIGRSVTPKRVDVNNVISGLSAMATVLMVFYVALQTHATKESINEMKTQRLVQIILPASDTLLEIKAIVQDNEECLIGKWKCIGYKPWKEGIFDRLRDISEYLEKSELLFATSLIPELDLYTKLKEYHKVILSLRRDYYTLSSLLREDPKISTIVYNTMIILCEDQGENQNYGRLCVEMRSRPIQSSQFEPKKVTKLKGIILYILFSIYSEGLLSDTAGEYYTNVIQTLKNKAQISEKERENIINLLEHIKEDVVHLKQLHKDIPDQIDKFIIKIRERYIHPPTLTSP